MFQIWRMRRGGKRKGYMAGESGPCLSVKAVDLPAHPAEGLSQAQLELHSMWQTCSEQQVLPEEALFVTHRTPMGQQ